MFSSCIYLARCYAITSLNSFQDSLSLTQRAWLHIREARAWMDMTRETKTKASQTLIPSSDKVAQIENQLKEDEHDYKAGLFTSIDGANSKISNRFHHRQQVFFDIALNYIDVDLEGLSIRAHGKKAEVQKEVTAAGTAAQKSMDNAVHTVENIPTSRLGGLLGSWWGKR